MAAVEKIQQVRHDQRKPSSGAQLHDSIALDGHRQRKIRPRVPTQAAGSDEHHHPEQTRGRRRDRISPQQQAPVQALEVTGHGHLSPK